MSHDQDSMTPFEISKHVSQFSFLLASSLHHPSMNYHYIFLLLLVVLSTYSGGPQHAKAPDLLVSTMATVCPNSSFVSLGVLALVLPRNEVLISVLPQNGVFKFVLPQHEVYKTTVPQNGVFTIVLPQNEVYRDLLPQTEVIPVQIEFIKSEFLIKK